MTAAEVVEKIRKDELDCNNQQLFFSAAIKALMVDLRNLLKIRNIPVPHMIINTGDDTMWLLEKEYDYTKEPCEVTNEQYVYNVVPRCIVSLGAMDMVPDQLTNPYVRGNFQYEYDNQLFTFNAEFRRLPVKISVNLKYVLDTFTDTLEMMQHICTKLAFIRTYRFVYMGQTMVASYKIPESMEDQHQVEIPGDLQENRDRTIELQLEVETNIPVFSPKTAVEAKIITKPITSIKLGENDATITRHLATGAGYRGPGWGQHKS